MHDILFLVLGFVVLFISGKYLVVGGVQLARFFKVPTLVIGLTIVSFGTSAPELLVSLKAAFTGHPDIAMGNVVGSNISNIALVLGLTALIFPIPVVRKVVRFDWPIMMGITLLLYILTLNGILSRWEGLILIIALVGFNFHSIRKGRKDNTDDYSDTKSLPWYFSLLIIAASSVGLVFGADWLVTGASGLARSMGISERVISVSIIAFGTSVPELATSAVAAFKKETDISIGNIIGSNIFNIAGILGITSSIHPIAVNQEIIAFDDLWMLGVSLLLFFVMAFKNKRVSRIDGILLILVYSFYIYFLFRG